MLIRTFGKAARAALLFVTLAGLYADDHAPAGPPPVKVESSTGQWVFSLAPKSLQKNPLVDQTIITEMTDAGRQVPAVTKERPGYYIATAAGYHAEGNNTSGDRPPPAELLTDNLHRALAVNGFLPAGPGHPPTLLIVYFWGVHNTLDAGAGLRGSLETGSVDASSADGGSPQLSQEIADVGHKNLLSRAALVGGEKFAAELKKALAQHDREAASETLKIDLLDPLKLFVEGSPRNRQLFAQAQAGCYYLVASAYDYAAFAHHERRLLWRSKMTVDASGVSMTDTLPNLVLNAGRYFGRDMPESATLVKRANGAGTVRLAPIQYENDEAKPAEAAAGPKPAAKP